MIKTVLVLFSLSLIAGCSMLPTTLMMSKKEPPMKVEVVNWDFGSMYDRLGVFIWVDQPTWAAPIAIRDPLNKTYPFVTARYTTNHPMMRVFLDDTLMGKECRWETKALEQSHRTISATDFNFGNGVKISSDDAHGSGQSTVDCEKIKAMILNDPRYKGKIAK